MNKFVIIADSTCDLEDELQKKYDIKVLPGHCVLPDKREILTYPRWDVFTRKEFYDALKANPDGFVTSPANSGEFEAAFREAALEGLDVLCMTISSGISGAYNFALQAEEAVHKDFPDITIKVIDSRRFGPGFGLMAVYASKKREAGMSLSETADWIEANKNRFHQAGWLDDLSFVAKKGRMTNAKAFFGTLAGIKPIGEFDRNGLTTVIGKIKGAKKALKVLIGYIKETVEDPKNQVFYIAHTERYAQAEVFKELIENEIHPKDVLIMDVHVSSGANVGPGLMAAYYVGAEITDTLKKETAIVDKFNMES